MHLPAFSDVFSPHAEHVMVGLLAFVILAYLLPLLGRRARVNLTYGWGEVYVLRDVGNPRLLKVGMTRRRTETRMREVSETMTGGVRLERIYSVKVPYVASVEALAHANLRSYRYRSERGTEWFRTDAAKAIRAVNQAARAVRKEARRQRKWSRMADQTSARWRMTKAGPVTERLF